MLSNLINNGIFLFFNLAVFYTIYWAYKEDEKLEDNNKQPFNQKKKN